MALSHAVLDKIKDELNALNDVWKDADQCYHFETNPPHVLFNLNCPDELQARVRNILSRYTNIHESNS
jgi:hypothetical protein